MSLFEEGYELGETAPKGFPAGLLFVHERLDLFDFFGHGLQFLELIKLAFDPFHELHERARPFGGGSLGVHGGIIRVWVPRIVEWAGSPAWQSAACRFEVPARGLVILGLFITP